MLILNFPGTIGVGIIVFIISFSGCNVTLAITLLLVAVTLQGTIPAGPMAVLIDLSPNFACNRIRISK